MYASMHKKKRHFTNQTKTKLHDHACKGTLSVVKLLVPWSYCTVLGFLCMLKEQMRALMEKSLSSKSVPMTN